MGIAKSSVLLVPDGSMTRTTWTLDIDMGASRIGHYFGLMMDRMVGKDYETGMPNAEIGGFDAEPVQLTAKPTLLVSETSPRDTPSVSKAYADAYGQIARFMAKNKLHMAGAPLGINGESTATAFTFEAGIPIDRADVTNDDNVRLAQVRGRPHHDADGEAAHRGLLAHQMTGLTGDPAVAGDPAAAGDTGLAGDPFGTQENGSRGQAPLRGHMTLAGESSASAIQAILSTCEAARIAAAACSGITPSPPP